MKHFLTLITLCCFANTFFAQVSCVPDRLHLSAVARDASGNPITAPVNVKIVFTQGSTGGTILYCETSTTTPNPFGEFVINIGDPANLLCTPSTQLSALPWANCGIFYNIYYTTGFTFPTTPNASGQFTTTPFAFAARSAEKLTTPATATGQVLTWNGSNWVAQTPNNPNSTAAATYKEVFRNSTTWTCPTGVTSIMVESWGAGGGGGVKDSCICVFSPSSYGLPGVPLGSGGSGGFSRQIVNVTPGIVYPLTVGNGGQGGIYPNTNGSAGGTTSFNGLVTAQGGGGGTNGHCNTCTSGVNGTNGVGAIPYNYIPPTSLPNYISTNYVDVPYRTASGGYVNQCQVCNTFYTGGRGEDGCIIISY